MTCAQELLRAFKRHKVKFIPLTDTLESLIKRRSGAFDVLVLGFAHSKYLQNKEFRTVLKPGGVAWIEGTSFVPFSKRDDRNASHGKLEQVIKDSGLKMGGTRGYHYRCLN